MDTPSNVMSSHGSLNKPGSSANMGSQINLMAEPSKASVEKVLDTARLTDRGWEAVQKKTFTNWVNTKLKIKNYAAINDIVADFSSGEKLIQLLEIIGDESLGKHNKNPKLRLQKIENVNTALSFVKRRGVQLTNIGAEDVVDANPKLVLGLIWSIILRFSIADISQEGLTAKEGLLLWCQRKTANYAPEVSVKDFHMSWKDGLPFCALIHRHRPDLLKYHDLDKSKKHENTALAFDIAEKHLNIPKLLDVEDITESAKPDERSVMTYVAQYFHAFSALDKVETAGRRVNQFAQVVQAAWELENDYERRVHKLMTDIAAVQAEWAASRYESYRDAKKGLHEFESYKGTTKRTWVAEKRELDTLLGNIQTKLSTYNLRPYTPPAGLAPPDLENCWTGHVAIEAERKRIISNYIRDIKEYLRKKYAEAANNFIAELNNVALSLASMDGELEVQSQKVAELVEKLDSIKPQIDEIRALNAQCEEAAIEDNEYTIYSVDDITFEWELLSNSLNKKAAFIKNQVVTRNVTNVSPQKLEAYSKTFRHFDRDNTNTLGRLEFKAALQAEGVSYPDAEFDRIFKSITKENETIDFEAWIEFVRALEEDRSSPEQLKASFTAIAGGKDYVTENDMYTGQIPVEIIEYLKIALPKKENVENGYDYQAYLQNIFA